MKQPEPFLEVRVKDLTSDPSILGLCVGYEQGEWRSDRFASNIMEWLPEFALTHSELTSVHPGNMVSLMQQAAKMVYKTEKFKNRGEFGELILHAAIRQVFESLPAISKIYYKSALNETVKGFDAVHVVDTGETLELWLGEAKFYKDINAAIRDVVEELKAHTDRNYLRDEFLLITGKIDPAWPHEAELKKLLSPNTSLDQVFKRVCIPVLLTYDSLCISKFNECSDEYCEDFLNEIIKNYEKFCAKDLPANVTIHLFLLPLESKETFVKKLDDKLRAWQSI